ncbi:MAG: lysophospholipid acyltransferase family protein [Spirochaetota bacterium]
MRSRLVRAIGVSYSEMFTFARLRNAALEALAAPFFVIPAAVFVLRLLGLDRRLRRSSLVEAMTWVLRTYYGGVSLLRGYAPGSGPVLFVGNHPGLGDLPAMIVAAGRDDVFAVAKERALTAEMPGILERCILINDSLASRAAAMRGVIGTLRDGHAVVIYPAGAIESDPALPGVGEKYLRDWPPFVDGIARRARRENVPFTIVPVYAEGVHRVPSLYRRLLGSPSDRATSEGRAALLTMMTRASRTSPVRVAFGEPIAVNPRDAIRAIEIDLTTEVRRAIRELAESARARRDAGEARAPVSRYPAASYPLTAPEVSPRTTPR